MFNKVILVCKNLLYGSVYRHYNNDLDSLKVSDLFTMSVVGVAIIFSAGEFASFGIVVPS